MSPAKRMVFEDVAGGLLKELGYDTYENVPKSVARYLLEVWCLLGRGGRFKRVLGKLGMRSKLERDAARGKAS